MDLQGYIGELLKNHNCVIVPEFGGFVANYKSAVVDDIRQKIYPPSKAVLFNPHLTNNDGLLCNHVSQKQDLAYAEAVSWVADKVAIWNKQLNEGERIEIGEIGFLYAENGNVHFEQSREVNLLLNAYGLRSVRFVDFTKQTTVVPQKVEEKPVLVEKKEEPKETVSLAKKIISVEKIEEKAVLPIVQKEGKPVEEKAEIKEEAEEVVETTVISLDQAEAIQEESVEAVEEYVDETTPRRRVGLTILKYTAAAAIVPILFYSYWIPMETDALETKSIQLSDFNPIHQQQEKSYKHRDTEFVADENLKAESWEDLTQSINAPVYNFELAEDLYVPIQLSEPMSTDVDMTDQQETAEVNYTPEVNSSALDYHVISGCFSVLSNAENLVESLRSQGFNASILDKKGGLHRVSAGDYATREEAKDGLNRLKGSGESGWILKK